jgi:hypothetical protein
MLITDAIAVFKKGKALTNKSTWANATALTGVLAGFLGAAFSLAKAFGYDVGVTDETINNLAAGAGALVLVVTNVLHVAANPHAGVQADGAAGSPDRPESGGG